MKKLFQTLKSAFANPEFDFAFGMVLVGVIGFFYCMEKVKQDKQNMRLRQEEAIQKELRFNAVYSNFVNCAHQWQVTTQDVDHRVLFCPNCKWRVTQVGETTNNWPGNYH